MIKSIIFVFLIALTTITNTNAKTVCKEVADNKLKTNQYWLLCENSDPQGGGLSNPGGSRSNSGLSNNNLVASGSEFQPVYKSKPTQASFGFWGRK